jgi:hypothetical protein
VCVCVRVHVRVRVRVHACCACACVLLLHPEPTPLVPATAWLGQLSAAPPFAAATLLFPPLPQPVLLTLGLVLVLGLMRGLGGELGGRGAFSAHRWSATHQTLFSPNPEAPEPLNKYFMMPISRRRAKTLFTRGEVRKVRYGTYFRPICCAYACPGNAP